jgi:hypothetical protein
MTSLKRERRPMRHKIVALGLLLVAGCLFAEVTSTKLKAILELSKKEHASLLGQHWLISNGNLKNDLFPDSASQRSVAHAFFEDETSLIYSFESQKQTTVAILNIGDRTSKTVTVLPQRVFSLAVSPDKSRLALITGASLSIVDVKGGTNNRIAGAWRYSFPSWSPDSGFVVFEKNRENDQGWGHNEVAVLELASGKVKVLAQGRFPAWSPRGNLIAFTDIDGKEVKVMAPRGDKIKTLKRNVASIFGPVAGPLVWSPDEKSLIIHRLHDDINGETHSKAYLLQIATGNMKFLASDETILAWTGGGASAVHAIPLR